MNDYKRILNDLTKNYCDLTEDSIVSYVRSMSSYGKKIVDMWNEKYSEYYIYCIDGDHWSEQPRWKQRYITNQDFIDKETVFKLNELLTYKDSMVMYADEFIIFSEKDLDEDIKALNKTLEFTVSAIKIKVNNFIIKDEFKKQMMEYFYKLKKLKNEYGRSTIFEMEVL